MHGMTRTRWRLGAALTLAGGLALGACAPQTPQIKPMAKPAEVVEATPAPAPAPVPTGPVTIALLAPMSGPAAAVGQSLRVAAETMLTGPEGGADAPRLLVLDTQGTPEAAAEAAKAAVAAGAHLVVGPLFGANAPAVRPILAAAGIPALSPTNTLAAAGDSLFVMGHAPQPQVERIVGQAAENGQTRVLVVGPDTAYARLSVEAVRQMADKGVVLVATDLYPANLNYNSLVARVKGLARQPGDVVLIPAGGVPLVGLSSLFQYFTQVGEKQLLGTVLWEETKSLEREISLRGGRYLSTRVERPVATEPEATLETAPEDLASVQSADALGDALMTAEAPSAEPEEAPLVEEAPAEPKTLGGLEAGVELEVDPSTLPRKPDNLEALVMDAVALGRLWSGNRDEPLVDYLTEPRGFQGASGLFRMTKDGQVHRSYSVFELTRQGAVLVGAPLERFPGATEAPVLLPTADIPPRGRIDAPAETPNT
jgi:hypothetical protein